MHDVTRKFRIYKITDTGQIIPDSITERAFSERVTALNYIRDFLNMGSEYTIIETFVVNW